MGAVLREPHASRKGPGGSRPAQLFEIVKEPCDSVRCLQRTSALEPFARAAGPIPAIASSNCSRTVAPRAGARIRTTNAEPVLKQLRGLGYSLEREEDIGPDARRLEREGNDEFVLRK